MFKKVCCPSKVEWIRTREWMTSNFLLLNIILNHFTIFCFSILLTHIWLSCTELPLFLMIINCNSISRLHCLNRSTIFPANSAPWFHLKDNGGDSFLNLTGSVAQRLKKCMNIYMKMWDELELMKILSVKLSRSRRRSIPVLGLLRRNWDLISSKIHHQHHNLYLSMCVVIKVPLYIVRNYSLVYNGL